MHFRKILNTLLSSLPLFISTFFTAHAQEPISNFSNEWKKVDGLVAKGLTKSALAEVDKIYALSSQEW